MARTWTVVVAATCDHYFTVEADDERAAEKAAMDTYEDGSLGYAQEWSHQEAFVVKEADAAVSR